MARVNSPSRVILSAFVCLIILLASSDSLYAEDLEKKIYRPEDDLINGINQANIEMKAIMGLDGYFVYVEKPDGTIDGKYASSIEAWDEYAIFSTNELHGKNKKNR